MPQNSFLSDKSEAALSSLTPEQNSALLDQLLKTQAVGREIDLNKPVIVRTPYNEFPRMLYHHESGAVVEVKDEKQLKAAEKRGFKKEPSPRHDYSQIRNGRAAVKGAAHLEENVPSAEDFVEEDEAEEN